MSDDLTQRRATRDLPAAAADMLDLSTRLAAELQRLGEGIEALAAEYDAKVKKLGPCSGSGCAGCQAGALAYRLRMLLRGGDR